MGKLVSLRFVRPDPPYNTGEVAGFSAHVARTKVEKGLAIYRDPADIPDDHPADPEDGEVEEAGEAAKGANEPGSVTPLTESFPARATLERAGIHTEEDVPRTTDELLAIDGIGAGYARRILAALGAED